MRLREVAHSRTGDKGNTSNISVIALDPKDYPLLVERVTTERVLRISPRSRPDRSGATSCRTSARSTL